MLQARLRASLPYIGILIVAAGVCSFAQDLKLPQLPTIPESLSLAVHQQLSEAYQRAARNSVDPTANGELGMMLQAYSQLEAAEICYLRAHLLDSASFRWTYYLGSLQAQLGKYEQAIVMLKSALSINPKYQPARLKLAECLRKKGNWSESSSLYEAVLREEPNSAHANFGLGRVRAATGNQAEAIRLYKKACAIYPNFAAAHYALGLALHATGDDQGAAREMQIYQQNQTSEPSTGDALLEEVEALNRGPLAQMRLGMELERAGKLKEAVEAHEKALAIDPNVVQAHVNLISLYGRLGEYDKAQQHFREAVRREPNNPEAHYDFGVLLFERSEYNQAGIEFQKTINIDPRHAEALHNLGYILEQRGQLPEALSKYEAAIAARPNYSLAHFHAGRILVNQGQFDRGIEHLRKAASDESDAKSTYLYALGAAFARAGHFDDAHRYLQLALDNAIRLGQTQLVSSIEGDLKRLEQH